MLKSGKVSVIDIARIMGHASPQMVLQKYAQFVKSEKVKVDKNFDFIRIWIRRKA